MTCVTKMFNAETGKVIAKPKERYETLDDAIKACKELNTRPDRVEKIVSYKCDFCHKYHTGRNGKEITDKYREKITPKVKEKKVTVETPNFKIIGYLDLSTFKR